MKFESCKKKQLQFEPTGWKDRKLNLQNIAR